MTSKNPSNSKLNPQQFNDILDYFEEITLKDKNNLITKKRKIANRKKIKEDSITIIGSTGGRFGLIFNGGKGYRLFLNGLDIQLEMGIGTFYKTIELARKYEEYLPYLIDVLLCSHCHLDHYGDILAFVEAITLGSKVNRGKVITNETVLSKLSRAFPYYFVNKEVHVTIIF